MPHGEFGLEVIALIGKFRFREHRSVPEMHQALQARGISIAQRSVRYLMQRYEELVTDAASRIKSGSRHACRSKDTSSWRWMDCNRMWATKCVFVVRDCLSQEILLARPLLSSTQGDLTTLLTEVKRLLEPWKVPVKGIISDGEETIGSAVAFVFPEVPHQLCQFHYLKDATEPLYDADRHAKTQLKKHLRGVRPLERALEARSDPESQAIRGYCLAVRSSLTDDGRSPLQASGLKLQDRLSQVRDSIARVEGKKAFRQP